jgi:hypothetical protein
MTEPSASEAVSPASSTTGYARVGSTVITVSGPMVEGTSKTENHEPPAETDPIVTWLTSDDAIPYRNHWVALNPTTGEFLGLADEIPHVRRWQGEGALIVFVDPPSRA